MSPSRPPLGIKYGLVADNADFLACAHAVHNLAVRHERGYGRLRRRVVVANKFCRDGFVNLCVNIFAPRCVLANIAPCPCARSRCSFIAASNAASSTSSPFSAKNLACKVDGETIGVVELKRIVAGEHLFAFACEFFNQAGQNVKPLIDCLLKALLLNADNLLMYSFFSSSSGYAPFDSPTTVMGNVAQKRAVDAQEFAVACRTAQQPAQHVAAPLVGWYNAVGNKERRRADVVGHNAQRYVRRVVLAIFYILRAAQYAS